MPRAWKGCHSDITKREWPDEGFAQRAGYIVDQLAGVSKNMSQLHELKARFRVAKAHKKEHKMEARRGRYGFGRASSQNEEEEIKGHQVPCFKGTLRTLPSRKVAMEYSRKARNFGALSAKLKLWPEREQD